MKRIYCYISLSFLVLTERLPARTLEADSSRMNLEIQEIVVSGEKRTSPLQELTVEPAAWETSISYISSEDVRKTGAIHLFESLKYSLNGLPSTQGRRKKHYYLLRGQNMASDYAINGISLSTNGAGPMAEWVEAPTLLPSSMIESIEVVRSGNSLLLGFSGLNGVVNIKTKTFDTFTTQAEIEYGTFNTLHYGIVHGGKTGKLRYALSVFNDKTDGPKNRHSQENLWNIYGKLDYRYKDKVELKLENFYTYGTRYVAQALFDSLASPQSQLADLWEYDPMRYNITTAKLKIKESETAATELQFSYILNRMDLYPDRYHYISTGKVIQLSDSIQRNRMLDEPDSIFTAALFQAFAPVKNNVVRAGVMYASSANYAHGKSKKKIVSATLLDQHTFGKWDVHAGGKLIREYYDYYVPGQGFGDATQTVVNEWQPALLNVSAGVSATIHPRNTLNFILNSGALPVDKTALQQVTDKNGLPVNDATTGKTQTAYLKREIRTGIELGWKQHSESMGHFVYTLFFLNQKNTSEYTQTPYYDDRNVLRYYMKNIDLQTCGIEMSFRSHNWMESWYCSGNLSYKLVRQKENSSRKRYAKQPPFIANLLFSFSTNNWEVNASGKYVSSYKSDRFLKQEVDMGNYFNCDANIHYALPGRRLRLYASIVNVFDERYATVSPLYPEFGRQIKTGIKYNF